MPSNTKYTHEEVAKFFNKQGCKLLEPSYINAHHVMKYRCSCSNEAVVSWHAFRRGARCAECGGTKKLDHADVIEVYKQHDCELLDNYVNSSTAMKFLCKCGSTHQKTYWAFKRHPFCTKCGKTCRKSNQEVAEFYKKHGCELLDEYKTNDTSMKFKCKCGRVSSKKLQNFEKYPQCMDCFGLHHYTLDEAKQIFKDGGCTLLEETYTNAHTKMRYRCKCDRVSKISLEKFKRGSRCKQCAVHGENNGRWNPDRELVKLNATIASRSLAHLKQLLKLQGKKKELKMRVLLGYTVSQLRDRIIGHTNWAKVKDKKWHIDHIFPVKAFLEHGITDLKVINALDNLQPLSRRANLRKGSKYNKADFLAWLGSNGIKQPD